MFSTQLNYVYITKKNQKNKTHIIYQFSNIYIFTTPLKENRPFSLFSFICCSFYIYLCMCVYFPKLKIPIRKETHIYIYGYRKEQEKPIPPSNVQISSTPSTKFPINIKFSFIPHSVFCKYIPPHIHLRFVTPFIAERSTERVHREVHIFCVCKIAAGCWLLSGKYSTITLCIHHIYSQKSFHITIH